MKFNLNKKVLTVTALFGLAVGVIVYVVAYAATVICPVGGCAAGAGAALTPGATIFADTFIGSGAADVVDDGGGNDILYLGTGADTVPCGDPAADCPGDDFIDGGPGGDIVGGPTAACANAANVLGNDFIIGGPESALDGVDTLCGGPGNDYLFGAAAGDTLAGYADNDVIIPGTAVDTVCDTNAAGAPAVCGALAGAANAQGAGDDVFIIYAGDVPAGGTEYLGCGTGNDVFIFVGFSALPTTTVPDDVPVGDVDATVTDPITGGVYNIANDGATACTLTN